MLIDKLKYKIAKILEVRLDDISLAIPPSNDLGDFSISLFNIAKKKKTSPNILAENIASLLKDFPEISEVSSINGYVNFRISNTVLHELLTNVLNGILTKINYGLEQQIMVEFFSPNTNKPLHIGHLRNIFIGDALCNLFEYVGFNVVRANLYNDRGIHICKAQLAYEKWGDNSSPQDSGKKGDHFVGEFYVLYNNKLESNPDIEDEAQLLLQRWEKNEREVIENWKKIRDWVIDGFGKTLDRMGIKPFDINYWESEYWREGVSIVKEGLEKGIFQVGENGSIIANLEQFGIKPLLRADGTALYFTQDIYLAAKKFSDYPELAKSIYVVAAEQTEHFKALFELLKLMDFEWSDKCYHLGYGMILLKGGKLKSREGITADADTTIDDLEILASKELIERNPLLDSNEMKLRASRIALSAIKWEFLKINALSNINFNLESSLELKGNTGPYILYTYARICSLKRKGGNKESIFAIIETSPSEREILSLLYFYPYEVIESTKNYNFSNLCTYLYQLATKFNAYYQVTRIIDNNEFSDFRLDLANAVGIVLKEGLQILGIETLEEM